MEEGKKTVENEREEEYRERLEKLNAREAELGRRERRSAVAARCREQNIPEDFAPWLVTEDEAESLQRVDDFGAAFRTAVQNAAAAQAGSPPPAVKPAHSRDLERLRGLSAQEINAAWEEMV